MLLALLVSVQSYAQTGDDTNKVDLKFPFKDKDPSAIPGKERKLYMESPSNLKSRVEYDPVTGQYIFVQGIGDSINYRRPTYMTTDEYLDYDMDRSMREYWREKVASDQEYNKDENAKGFRPSLQVESEKFDRIFGGNTIDIRPSGSVELQFGVNISRTDNPQIPERQRRITTFDFNEKIQLNVIGNIGEKLKIMTNYNTEATFDFENQMKLEYTGYEDEIIKKIELGNVSLPLSGSLITGSQSLFGVKTQLQFGRLMVTSVYSQQRGRKSEIEVQGGAQTSEYEIKADNYEFNRHFFLSHFFRDQYERAVANPPLVASGAVVTKIEVWVTNTNFNTRENRNVIALQDLGETGDRIYNTDFVTVFLPGAPADNTTNNLYERLRNDAQIRGFNQASNRLDGLGLESFIDYQKIDAARKLTDAEFTFHPQLGYISLNQELQPTQALAVAFQYTFNGQTYQVGEFSTDGINGTDALLLKMLKSAQINTRIPMWDLMMKNVYSIGAFQVQREGFRFDIWYLNQETGVEINFIPEGPIKGLPLIQVLGLDRVNPNGSAVQDGVFDFLDNPRITINPQNGRVYFPVLEPFGTTLREALGGGALGNKYAFDSLYTNTQANAQYNFPEKNRFIIKGTFQSASSSEISLNAFNIPQGSVVVTAGGAQLVENQDYTVDYNLGRVKILNQSIMESGTPIKISLESNSLFNIQSKSLFATRFDYKISEDFVLGGTVMNLTERPLTQKINIGDEPISNTVVGIDGSYTTQSQLLTTWTDKIPFIDTKEESSVSVTGEVARFIPGHSKAIGKDGISYIDDFEGSQSTIDMRSFTTWVLASTPRGQENGAFPEGGLNSNELGYGFNRAKLAWYVVDPLFYRDDNLTPDHIRDDNEMQSNHFMREIFETEVFPNRQFAPGQFTNIPMFDLAFYPEEVGPYNYDVEQTSYSDGLNDDGSLANPESRWGGIMREITTANDFDAANIEFIQFWLMDPYAESPDNEGQSGPFPGQPGFETDGFLYFNLGNISEDILRDGEKSFENGLPTDAAGATDLSGDTTSNWGRVPRTQLLVNAFDIDPDSRQYQDVGFDGLRNQEERLFFDSTYINRLATRFGAGSAVYNQFLSDPSHDDFRYFKENAFDDVRANILERYKNRNGMEGNSPVGENIIGNIGPDIEDINGDNTLDDAESYYQYRVEISPQALSEVGKNYITDILETTTPTLQNGQKRPIRWIQFKIPIREWDDRIGNISDFRSIRFMRIFMNGFEKPIFFRFARMELVRGEWRRYTGDLDDDGIGIVQDQDKNFNIAAVNIEENSSKTPVNYVLPPDINREIAIGTANLQQLNEQSLSMTTCDLEDGEARAAFRNVNLDVLSYKKLEMYIHAEALDPDIPLNDYDLNVFIRLGTDFNNNYYEYEIPVTVTPPDFYDPESFGGREAVWPFENNIEIEFKDMRDAKAARNRSIFFDEGASLQARYEVDAGAGRKIFVVGNPNFSDIRTIMIGVRNPSKDLSDTDDGLDKCAEIWVNELRLSDFDQQGGWASVGRVTARLADFATVSVSGSMSTPGWGSIDKKVSERQRETLKQFDASTTIELGKFFPEKIGLKVPMYLGYSEVISNPQFAPLEPDTPFKDYLEGQPDDATREQAKRENQSFIKRRSINFTNVRKERTNSDRKARFYDVENLSATYAYSETFMRNINTEFNSSQNYRGGLSYNYSAQPKNIRPLSKVKLLRKSKYLRVVRDFNLYTMPKQVSFRTDLNRLYSETKTRNNNPGFAADLPVFVDKNFNWSRSYSFAFDLTRSLKFNFNANNDAIIDEYQGARVNKDNQLGAGINPETGEPFENGYELHRDTLLNSLRNFGSTMYYNHSSSLDYNLPLSKFPLTDWLNSTARYTANYEWRRAPFAADSLGNTISNSNQLSLNGTANMITLYNKIGYLKKINQKRNKRGRGGSRGERANPRAAEADTTNAKKEKEFTIIEQILKVGMSLKNVSLSYTQGQGTSLPGYARETRVIGMDPQFSAPGVGFIFGQQDNFGPNKTHFADYAGNERGWLEENTNVFTQYSRSFTENLNMRATIEPFNDMRIELNAVKMRTRQNSEFWAYDTNYVRDDGTLGGFVGLTPQETGNYSISVATWRTAFASDDDDFNNAVYDKFLANRTEISQRLADANPESIGPHETDSLAGYRYGYGSAHQEVLIPAFLAAYSGKSAGPLGVGLSPFIKIPKPNWRVTYTGLSKVKMFKRYFQTITLNHAYRSTFNVSNYQRNLNAGEYLNGNFVSENQITSVSISEQFSPLLNIDVSWANIPSLSTRVEFKKDRNLTLNTGNAQLTEVRGNEIVVGAGYTFQKLKLGTVRGQPLESDLDLRADVSLRSSTTVIRGIITEVNQATAGQRIITIKFTADYRLSKSLNLRLYYDRVANRPVISNAFPTANTNIGVSLRFTLSS